MARPQMLYTGPEGAVSYEAIGNVEVGSGDKGTIALWFHHAVWGQRNEIVKVIVDDDNQMRIRIDQERWVFETRVSGVVKQALFTGTPVQWRHVVATWDFSAGPEDGVLKLYLDGIEVASVTGAWALVGPPAEIIVGPGTADLPASRGHVTDTLCVWNDAISAAAVEALYERGRHYVPREEDGAGTLTMRATWDGSFDADVAEGSGVATLIGAADQYCRLDVGSRRQGNRFSYLLGLPDHDDPYNERVPGDAVLVSEAAGTSITNMDDHAQIDVDASGVYVGVNYQLAPWLPEPMAPMTLRVTLYVPNAHTPGDLPVAIGAVNYYKGDEARLVCGEGCTTNTIVASGIDEADGFWAGAELHMLTGNARNQKLRVADSSQAGQSLTLDGQLSEAPAAGDVAIVTRPGRLEPPTYDGHLYRLECDLCEGNYRFQSVETAAMNSQGGYTCINYGRLQRYPVEMSANQVRFGKRGEGTFASWQCRILLERIEVDGPGVYAKTTAPDDTFLVTDPHTGESIKLWRTEGVEREVRIPEQYSDPQAIQDAIMEPGTWRHSLAYWPTWMEYEPEYERIRALAVGEDESGVQRAGYILGTWDETLGHVVWEDDPDPRNPFLEIEQLKRVLERFGAHYTELPALNAVFEVAEGDWVLFFTAGSSSDHIAGCALTGAPDRYSFDPEKHFDPQLNPLTPADEGIDKVVPEGGGATLYGNWDHEPRFVQNPWRCARGNRFLGYARAKTIVNNANNLNQELSRPLACLMSEDMRNLRRRPWRNAMIVPCYGWFHWPHPEWFGPNTPGLVVDDGGVTLSDVTLYASEDGAHVQNPLGQPLIPRYSPPFNAGYIMPRSNPVRLGRRRLYWYISGKTGLEGNMATIRLDGEALYRLSDGETTGELETSELVRERETWDNLRLNVDPKGGEVSVCVVDAETDEPLAGFDHGDFDGVGDEVDARATWNGAGLTEVGLDSIRLRFRLTRATAEDPSPELYAWRIARWRSENRPSVSGLRVEGAVNPTRVADPKPELSWEFQDREGRTQTAFQVLVSSSQEKLDAGEGDLWDSGVVVSDAQTVEYAGAQLGSEQTHFWKVRVRNDEGVWSEEW